MADSPLLRRSGITSGWICVAVVAAAILIIWPVAEMPYGDDTAYSYIALNLAQTGQFAYNGWETALLVIHAYWGALFIRLFGFSFECVRFSTIPFSLGAVGFCYLLVRRAGLRERAACFVTLLFGLSPLFLPVSVSYMTDAPALFFVFASLYSLSRAEEESEKGRGFPWLVLGTILGFMGGASRQIVWLVTLVVLPYLAWVRRRQTWFAIACLAACVLVSGGVAAVMAWFNHQPYAISQPSVFSELKQAIKYPVPELDAMARLLLMLFLMCLPAALPFVVRAWINTWQGRIARKMTVAALLLGVAAAMLLHPALGSIPWVASTLNWEGINGSAPLPGRPVVLTRPIRAVVAITVYAGACILLGELANIRTLMRRVLRSLRNPGSGEFTLAAMSIFSLVYFGLIVLRNRDFDVFDRYLLPILPWAATVLLVWFESDQRVKPVLPRVMPFAWALLGIFALYGIASTQDLWALARARASATRQLEIAGVPRTAIDAGFEYNAWTELLINGRLNSRWVVNPPGAYRAGLGETPSVVPLYRLEYKPTPETIASQFGTVPFVSFLPPFHKRVSIDRVRERSQPESMADAPKVSARAHKLFGLNFENDR